jgi:hypothetical protein
MLTKKKRITHATVVFVPTQYSGPHLLDVASAVVPVPVGVIHEDAVSLPFDGHDWLACYTNGEQARRDHPTFQIEQRDVGYCVAACQRNKTHGLLVVENSDEFCAIVV